MGIEGSTMGRGQSNPVVERSIEVYDQIGNRTVEDDDRFVSGSEDDRDGRFSKDTDFSEPILCCPIVSLELDSEFINRYEMDGKLLLEYGSVNESETTDWVKSQVRGLSKFLGMSYGGYEDQVISLFSGIDKKWKANGVVSPRRRVVSPEERRRRELKKLEWSINYVGSEGSGVVEGSERL